MTLQTLHMTDWIVLAFAVALLGAGLYFKPTRMAFAVLGLLGGIALNSTLYLAFIGIPMMLVSGALLYSEYAQRRHPHRPPAPTLTPAGPHAPLPPGHYDPRQQPADDLGPADDL